MLAFGDVRVDILMFLELYADNRPQPNSSRKKSVRVFLSLPNGRIFADVIVYSSSLDFKFRLIAFT